MYPSVKKVHPNDNFILSIVFDNDETGLLDMKPFLDIGVFRRLKDKKICGYEYERVEKDISHS